VLNRVAAATFAAIRRCERKSERVAAGGWLFLLALEFDGVPWGGSLEGDGLGHGKTPV
jgi:hypothetical protein